ncbi:Hcp1 family type VI secretion system effector [Herminiimonas sp. KBW02]|uniref:type VI secretion system tube protein Hcp n=1 Tax=Herminiimonas sp. KBW02 TaxID=2153363 RepID=UPI000F5A362E|nr:type VI secretion system tube protein Hcp [Herminiimonas sp. KBW02]RQO33886.1 Hcp1 family type VI secretion system effector [Herminiimonas sp. KBW02]
MDLILLQPGDPDFIPATSDTTGGSLIDPQWQDASLKLGRCLELVSVHQGMRLRTAITGEQAHDNTAADRPIITELTCVKYVDNTSVKLYDYCLRAQPLGKGKDQPTVLYIARNSGDKTSNIITLSLRDAIVSEIQFQSHPDDMPTEQFKLNFTEILWTYTVQSTNAETAGNMVAGWSIAQNRPITQFS